MALYLLLANICIPISNGLTNISICMKDSVSKFRLEVEKKNCEKNTHRNAIHPIEMFILTLLGNLTLICLTHRENKEVKEKEEKRNNDSAISLEGFLY